jgi:hypothetical protein
MSADASATKPVELERLRWVAPLTLVASVGAVLAVRVIAVWLIDPPSGFSPLGLVAPVAFTLVLVFFAIGVFVVVASVADHPLRVYRVIAFAALLISLVPCFSVARQSVPGGGWPAAIALMAMHVAAWYATVTTLARCCVVVPHEPE